METLTLLVFGAVNILCFLIGAKVGQMAVKGEEIKVIPDTPILRREEAHRSKESRKQEQREQEALEAILRNVEAYDGTSAGQEDIPRW